MHASAGNRGDYDVQHEPLFRPTPQRRGLDQEIQWKISDGEYIKQFAIDLADHIHMKRYGEPIAVRFGAEPKVEGYSLIQLIETSCIAGHFAEDTDRAFIDVFSCKEYPPEETAQYCKEYFGAKKMEYATLFRNI